MRGREAGARILIEVGVRDWTAVDALTDEEVLEAARSDPDTQPLDDA